VDFFPSYASKSLFSMKIILKCTWPKKSSWQKKETQSKMQPKWIVHQFSLMKKNDLTLGKAHW
jgi:hypothetical protein